MMRHRSRVWWLSGFATAAALGLGVPASVVGQQLVALLNAGSTKIQLAQASQDRIDEVVAETETLEIQYKQIMKEIDKGIFAW